MWRKGEGIPRLTKGQEILCEAFCVLQSVKWDQGRRWKGSVKHWEMQTKGTVSDPCARNNLHTRPYQSESLSLSLKPTFIIHEFDIVIAVILQHIPWPHSASEDPPWLHYAGIESTCFCHASIVLNASKESWNHSLLSQVAELDVELVLSWISKSRMFL